MTFGCNELCFGIAHLIQALQGSAIVLHGVFSEKKDPAMCVGYVEYLTILSVQLHRFLGFFHKTAERIEKENL